MLLVLLYFITGKIGEKKIHCLFDYCVSYYANLFRTAATLREAVYSYPVGGSAIYFNPPQMVGVVDQFGNIETVGLFDNGQPKWQDDNSLLRRPYQGRRLPTVQQNLDQWHAPFYAQNFAEELAIEQGND